MINFTYENQGINTYLVYHLDALEMIDTMSLGMLTNNAIPGLAQTLYMQIDKERFIKYNVSAKVTVRDYFTGVINRKRLLGVFGGIIDAMISAEEYMVAPGTIILDMDYIYTDVSSSETTLICLPLMEHDKTLPDMLGFFRNIMFSHQFDQTENCGYVAQIINYLNSTPVFSLYDFRNLLDSLKTQSAYGLNGQGQTPNWGATPDNQYVAPQPGTQCQAANQLPDQTQVPPKAVAHPRVAHITTAQPVVSAQPSVPVGVVASTQSPVNVGEEITLFQLLSHYNKENAAAYKAQKEAKKAAKKKGSAAPAASTLKVAPRVAPKAPQQPGVAVPGAPVNVSFAVPGQPAPAPASTGFKVPGAPSAAPAPQPSVPAAPAVQPVAQAPVAHSIPVVQTAVQAANVQMPANFGETTVLGGGAMGETTVLSGYAQGQPQIQPHLIRAKNDERIPIDQAIFRIGKERSYVNYFIGDNPAISRSHANIIRQGDSFSIVDANSTNHTFVNNVMIGSSAEHPLNHGDKVRLANEEFIFNLY